MQGIVPTTSLNASSEADCVEAGRSDPDDGPAAEGFLAPLEAEHLRSEKLEAIRRAIAAGAYDGPEIMDRALEAMLRSLEANGPEPA